MPRGVAGGRGTSGNLGAMESTYSVRPERKEELETRLSRLQERIIEEGGSLSWSFEPTLDKVNLEAKIPTLNGFCLVGRRYPSVEGEERIAMIPGEPKRKADYWDATCEHCETKVIKGAIYLIQGPEGDVRQIRKECLLAVTGVDPEKTVLAGEVALQAANAAFAASSELKQPALPLRGLLAAASLLTRKEGYIRAEEKENSTAAKAVSFLKEGVSPEEKDFLVADEIILWGKVMREGRERLNDYLWNLTQVLEEESVPENRAALAVSAVKAISKVKEGEGNQLIAKIGERVAIELVLDRFRVWEGIYGRAVEHSFHDQHGNRFIWNCTGKSSPWMKRDGSLAVGEVRHVTAEVGGYEEFAGERRTKIKRVTLDLD